MTNPRSMPRLVMVEGTIGSGKTTMASQIHQWLKERHIASDLFLEGDIHHPADFEHTAWLDAGNWTSLLAGWPANRAALEAINQPSDGGHLVPYGALEADRQEPLPEALYAELAARSVYDGTPLDRHRHLLRDSWQAFAETRRELEIVTVLECCFLQNPLMKFVVQHDAAPAVLVQHLSAIADAVQPFNPVVLYLAPSDIEGTIARAVRERSPEWLEAVIQYHVSQAFGRTHGLRGWEGFLTFLRLRPTLERSILDHIPVRTVVMEDAVSPERWDHAETLLTSWYPPSGSGN